jgi:hypothetical protein
VCHGEYTFDECAFINMAPGTGNNSDTSTAKRQRLAAFAGQFVF